MFIKTKQISYSLFFLFFRGKLARERSLAVNGAHIFNLLPINLRNENSRDFPLFKNNLDIFLAMVSD